MNHGMENQQLDRRLQVLFGADAHSANPLAQSGAGIRFTGIDLCRPLNEGQVDFLLDALSQLRIVCIAGQDLARFSLAHFERFANHWGAPIPHPSNFMRGGKPAQQDGASDGPIELIPYEKRTVAAVDKTFPDRLQCLPHESPTVLVVSNFSGKAEEGETQMRSGGHWHTDIEYETVADICVHVSRPQFARLARRSGRKLDSGPGRRRFQSVLRVLCRRADAAALAPAAKRRDGLCRFGCGFRGVAV